MNDVDDLVVPDDPLRALAALAAHPPTPEDFAAFPTSGAPERLRRIAYVNIGRIRSPRTRRNATLRRRATATVLESLWGGRPESALEQVVLASRHVVTAPGCYAYDGPRPSLAMRWTNGRT